ncbi:MAG: GNAT family N-acetyltransferase [Candidatus Limnocylindrales bacterium]
MSSGGGERIDLPGAPAIEGLAFRAFDPATDYPVMAALTDAVNRHDGVDWLPTAESLRHDWQLNDGFDPPRDVLIAQVGDDVVGAVDVDWRVRSGDRVFHDLTPMVRPDWRRRGIGTVLRGWAERRVITGVAGGEMGPVGAAHILTSFADLEVPGTVAFAEGAGYAVEGYGVMMLRALSDPIPDFPFPPGLEVRPVAPEQHRQIWDADTEAFRDHRDPGVRTEADYLRWFTNPEVDTALWIVAWDGDDVAGSVWNVVFHDENERLGVRRGWLEHVSVRRPWRRRGLASALIAQSMRRLRDLGLQEAALGADAANLSGAIRVYEALGFRRARTAAHFQKAFPNGEAGQS